MVMYDLDIGTPIRRMVMTTAEQPWKCVEPRGPYLRPAQAAAFCGISTPTLYEMVRAGTFPAPVRVHPEGKATVIPQTWLEAVLSARMRAAA